MGFLFARSYPTGMKNVPERIRMLEREEVSPEVGAIYDRLLAERGVVPYMFKTLAHTPDLALGVAAFLKPLMGDGALVGWYKELIATRVALLNDCDY
jgi:alkylhydroperoxidase family enzyme